jgi:serine protease AprX
VSTPSSAPKAIAWRRRALVGVTCAALAAGSLSAAPPAHAGLLSSLLGVLTKVTGLVDNVLHPDGLWGDPNADAVSTTSTGAYSAAKDPGSLYTIENAIGARSVWAQQDAAHRQITGQGVGIALLDSGVSPVAGLDGAGKLTYGPDLSIEANGPLIDQDTFGHGTHLAGIIGARDAAPLTATSIPRLDPNLQLGVAPDAAIEAFKLATTDGSTDVSQVIAALDWVTQHSTTADGTRIRVINVSYGTDSVQPYQADPLAAAVENAWKHGIVVVVSGGNEGYQAGRLTDPAIDPYVLAVGASDPNNSVSGWNSPYVAAFSSSGTAQRHVDLLAPGRSIVSLRDPGSYIDSNHPEGQVARDTSGRLFRGSGTSQAAAVVSGAVALLLQAYPNLTPDQVKYLLTRSATPVSAGSVYAGAGELNIAAALNQAANANSLLGKLLGGGLSGATQSFSRSTGQGSIEAARGGSHLIDADGHVLSGEIDVQGRPWNPSAWWPASSSLTAWNGGSWNGADWTGSSWGSTGGWSASRWSAARWSASRWSAARWSDQNWSAARWSADGWSAARWSDTSWQAARWSASRWN